MRAARYYGKKDVRIDKVAEPKPKEGQVKIKVSYRHLSCLLSSHLRPLRLDVDRMVRHSLRCISHTHLCPGAFSPRCGSEYSFFCGIMFAQLSLSVCGSDLHAFQEGLSENFMPNDKNPHPITGETLPVTLGHEYVMIYHLTFVN